MMKLRDLALATLAAALVVSMAGCSGIADKAAEETVEKAIEGATGAKGVEIDKGGESIKIKTDQGEAEIGGDTKSVPEGFPKEFPVYKGAEVTSSMKSSAEGKTNFFVNFETKDKPADVAGFFKREIPKSGYTISSTMEVDTLTTFGINKGEETVGQVMIQGEGGKTIINISITI